jgi:glycosyltransferase involved in cell wall biosynthesis
MRIAQISTLSAPVREESAGSVEACVWLLTRELMRLGHEVTVFGTGDSEVPGQLVVTQPGPYGAYGAIDDWQVCEWMNIASAVERSGEFDVLHSHAYLWGVPLSRLSRAPMVHTTHIVPDDNTAKIWSRYREACVTAISQEQWRAYPKLTPAAIIHHGVDASKFTFNPAPGDYVCYLGRFVSNKGPLHAIAVAKRLGLRLVMAGPPSPYFRENVQPLIDGRSVEYVGFVKGKERDELLGGAKALLYPIQFAESFGLVVVEAMLCGTPVAAMRMGAVPEIIEEGVSGFMAESNEGLGEALAKAVTLDRHKVRAVAGRRFSAPDMARKYVEIYEEVVRQKTQ